MEGNREKFNLKGLHSPDDMGSHYLCHRVSASVVTNDNLK
jgi:hypothetical protein